MIEVNLFAIPKGDNSASIGKCVARSRFDKDRMGVSIISFVRAFLKNNIGKFENNIGNAELVNLINSDGVVSYRDLASINYFLEEAGLKVLAFNVADDEENPDGVPTGEIIEWNIIDKNNTQNDLPSAVKYVPAPGTKISTILKEVIRISGLFDENKFSGIKSPFKSLIETMEKAEQVRGETPYSVSGQVYDILRRCGVKVFCATSED